MIEKMIIKGGERIVWLVAIFLLLWAAIVGTNTYNRYQGYREVAEAVDNGAIAKAESYDALKAQFAGLQGEIKDRDVAIEQLKQQTLR